MTCPQIQHEYKQKHKTKGGNAKGQLHTALTPGIVVGALSQEYKVTEAVVEPDKSSGITFDVCNTPEDVNVARRSPGCEHGGVAVPFHTNTSEISTCGDMQRHIRRKNITTRYMHVLIKGAGIAGLRSPIRWPLSERELLKLAQASTVNDRNRIQTDQMTPLHVDERRGERGEEAGHCQKGNLCSTCDSHNQQSYR